MVKKRQVELNRIELLILDVDGVLTDGTIIINSDGSESKFFNTHDGHGIRLWKRAGFKVVFLSGRDSPPTKHRAEQLEIDYVFQNCHDKLPVIKNLLEELNLTAEQAAYIGDDLMDLPVIRYVGFGAAVADAVDEVKKCADFVTGRQGGKGAVREVVEHILKSTGRWQELMERYLL